MKKLHNVYKLKVYFFLRNKQIPQERRGRWGWRESQLSLIHKRDNDSQHIMGRGQVEQEKMNIQWKIYDHLRKDIGEIA